jgi:hypothetical protein
MPYGPFFVLHAIYEIVVSFIRAFFTGKDVRLLIREEEQKQQRDFDQMLQNDPSSGAKELLQLLSKQKESYKVASIGRPAISFT